MILRAIFWIGLVAVLMPHEPDLGFGRPGSADFAGAASWAVSAVAGSKVQEQIGDPAKACSGREALCEGALSTLDSFQNFAVQSLSHVKAQIDAQQKARKLSRL